MFWYNGIGLKPLEESDLDMAQKLRSDMSTWESLTTIGQISKFQQKAWFEGISRDKTVAYYVAVIEQKEFPIAFEGPPLGIVRVDQIDVFNKNCRVGADVLPEKRGVGWGTKILKAIMKFCFDYWNMHMLHLMVLEDNIVARKLYKNVGFQENGILREAIFRNGKYLDYIVMSILDYEFKKSKKA